MASRTGLEDCGLAEHDAMFFDFETEHGPLANLKFHAGGCFKKSVAAYQFILCSIPVLSLHQHRTHAPQCYVMCTLPVLLDSYIR
jgi:hypothetical protein